MWIISTPGKGTYELHEFGLLGSGKVTSPGVMKDVRPISLILKGCCPPGLVIEILGGVELPAMGLD